MRLRRAASLTGVVVLVALLALAARRLDLRGAVQSLGDAHLPWILVALVAFAAILPLWGVQWWLLAPRTARSTPARMLGVVAMTSSVLNTTPMLVGEAAGVHFLAEHAGVDRASGLAVLAMDQLIVGLAKVFVLTAAASVLPLPLVMRDGIRGFAVAVLLLLLAMLALSRLGDERRRRLLAPLPSRGAEVLGRAIHALAPLRSTLHGGGALVLALLKKGCELLAIVAIQRAFGVELPPSSALVVLAALNLATLLPIVPGNAGIFEAAVVLAYGWLGVPGERALGMALVQHATYFVALALPGYAWLARMVPPRSAAAAP
jgi:uncharacterized membrane protein YbhN (UPF0104 family)